MKLGQKLDDLRAHLGLSSGTHQDTGERRVGRNRRAVLTGGTAVFARAAQVGTSLVTVPITIHYLGNERFGLWMTISTVLAMSTFADFGIGNGVLNTVADAYGKNDFDRIRRAISSGFAVLGAIGLALAGLLAASFLWVSWADIFRVTSAQARAEAGPAMMVFAVCFAINIPLDLVQRVQLGLQQGFRMNLWQVCGSFMGLAGVIVGIYLHAGLPFLVAALAGTPILATALNSFHFFILSRPDLMPRREFVSREAISQIGSIGGWFFVLQLMVAIGYSADNIIIVRTLGAGSVPGYSIPQRMFSLISIMVTMLIMPLWPAYGEALSAGDLPWVRRTLKHSLLAVFSGTVIASTTLLLIARWVIAWWIGPSISPPFILLLGLGLWTVCENTGATLSIFLNGAGVMRIQAVVSLIFGVTCLGIKVYLTRRYGIVAVPWATLLTYVPVVGIACVIYVPHALKYLYPSPNGTTMATPVIEG